MAFFFNLLQEIEEKMLKLRLNMVFEVPEVTSLPKDEVFSSLQVT
jgi:hypothetical protein